MSGKIKINDLVEAYHKQLMETKNIKDWLSNDRGLSEEIITKFKLGWTGKALSIPIYNKDNTYCFFKYRANPEIDAPSPKYWYDKGASAELYGWEHITNPKPLLILCAGELDRLLLETHGLPAVTLTSGEDSFNGNHAEIFKKISSVILICYDNDEAGVNGVAKVSKFMPGAKIVMIPKSENVKDVTEFINAYGIEEFRKLLESAKASEKAPLKIVKDMKRINLALAFTKDLAFITQPLPIERATKRGREIADVYCVICSNKEMFLASKENLYARKLYAAGNCYISETRWEYTRLEQWLNGEVKSNLEKLFNDIKSIFEKYLDYRDSRLYTLFALWVIGTYIFPLFDFYPILYLMGASGTGKSKTCCLIAQIGFNSINSANISDASFFRSIQGALATLICDEAETLDDPQRAGFINLLLAGIGKQGKVIRTEQKKEGEFVPTVFEVYSPKIVANIKGGGSEALINRCITVTMSPTKSDKGKLAIEEEEPEVFEEIRSQLYMFLMENWQEIKKVIKDTYEYSKDLNGYDRLIWKPILTLAKYFQQFVADKSLLETMVDLATEKTSEKKRRIALEQDTTLLEVIRDMYVDRVEVLEVTIDGDEFYATKHIRQVLAHRLDYKEGTEPHMRLTVAKVGKAMLHFNIGKSGQIRVKGEKNPVRGMWIKRSELNDTLIRFGMEPVDEKSRSGDFMALSEFIGGVGLSKINA